MSLVRLSGFALFVALLSASAASAGVVTYTDEATWEAAVSNNFVTEPFDSGGLQSFTGVVTTFGAIGPARGVLTGSVWTDFVDSTYFSGPASTTFSYKPANLFAAGATFDTSPEGEGVGLDIILNLVGGGTETVAHIGPIDGTFFGFVSTDAFTSFTITNGGGFETFDMDNLHFEANTNVPEPVTLSLFGAGLAGAIAMRRRKKNVA